MAGMLGGRGNISGFPIGTKIEILGWVVSQPGGGQTAVYLEGVGNSGVWHLPSTTIANGHVSDMPLSVFKAIANAQNPQPTATEPTPRKEDA